MCTNIHKSTLIQRAKYLIFIVPVPGLMRHINTHSYPIGILRMCLFGGFGWAKKRAKRTTNEKKNWFVFLRLILAHCLVCAGHVFCWIDMCMYEFRLVLLLLLLLQNVDTEWRWRWLCVHSCACVCVYWNSRLSECSIGVGPMYLWCLYVSQSMVKCLCHCCFFSLSLHTSDTVSNKIRI